MSKKMSSVEHKIMKNDMFSKGSGLARDSFRKLSLNMSLGIKGGAFMQVSGEMD